MHCRRREQVDIETSSIDKTKSWRIDTINRRDLVGRHCVDRRVFDAFNSNCASV